ncbi:hypothetical protein AYK25_01520 [Thermoplasmatales archaeon SM1-50]|nr:MAG: hypothetical protein AYK25_01520 [Thermoplasmatales archaeon SM1-50]
MKECVQCGKKLGVFEGYRHPIMGKQYLLCNSCFDPVFESVERYREAVATYSGFFHKEPSILEDMEKIGGSIRNTIERMHNKGSSLWSRKGNENIFNPFSGIH